MKRWKFLLSFLLAIVFIASPGFAAKSSSMMVKINGNNFEVRETPVLVDGQAMKADAPSYINGDTTFVHIRFVENYGAKVDWDQKTKTAIISQDGKEIKMPIDSDVIYVNGDKEQIDKKFAPKLVTFPNNQKYASTMIPFRMVSETLGYEVGYDESKGMPYINTSTKEMPEEIEPEPEEDLSHLNRVEDVQKEWVNGGESIVVYNTENISINTMRLDNPDRIIIDIKDSLLENGTYFEYDYELGFIKRVRVSQFSPDNNYNPNDKIVRIVLDIKDGVNSPEVKIDKDGDKLIITPEDNIWEILNYSMEGPNRIVSINANKITDYNVQYDEYLKDMTISLPVENIDLIEDTVKINDGLIKDISIEEIGNEAYITINFLRSAEYTILSRTRDDEISLSLKRDSNINPNDRVIVIDPGHGGKDPGAVKDGVNEKDINLGISLKLNEALQEKGYTTVMTRDEDTYPANSDRAKLANEIDADLYISIHSNSIENNSEISGIQILYYSKDKANVKKEETLDLATIMMEEITRGTGAQNKGLLPRDKTIVIRDANMAALLIETGFLTNPEERELLQTEEYQNLMVESIIKGIERYFEIY